MFNKIISVLEDQAIAKNTKRIKEILEFRRILEPEIAALAAESLDPNDLVLINTILDRQEKSLSEDKEDAQDDLHFHLTLARATKNEILVEVTAMLHDILRECRVPQLENLARKRISLQSHQEIYAALRERDSELSRSAMRDHLRDVESLLYGQRTDTST
jgi:GntR family transcriptional regulator, transcriptional repressor for pyruvate dehydrogenase complex